MKFVIYTIAGLGAGLIGAAVWAGIAFATNHEIGWIAWGVGFLVGFAVRMGTGHKGGAAPGVTAAIIAVLAIVAGKYAAASLLVEKNMPPLGPANQTDMVAQMALQVVAEHQNAGKELKWPEGKSLKNAETPLDYPPGIWEEANKRWNDFGAEKQQTLQQQRTDAIRQMMQALKGTFVWEAFKASFSPIDIIFFLLAIVTAFRLGAATESE